MPKVPTYETPALDIRPSETGIDALQQAARRTGAFYGQAAEDYSQLGQRTASALKGAMDVALQAEEHRETTAGAKNFATLVANKTDEWNKIAASADPNDPTLKQKFLDQLEPDLDKFASDGFITENGQKFAQAHVAQFRQHMFEKTTADMSRNAGLAAHANTRETENKLSNNAYNDPSSLDFTLKTWEDSINGIVGSSPNLGANAGTVRTTLLEHGREAIVKSAAIGAITRTGQVPGWVTDSKYSKYVNGAELEQFRKAAESVRKADLVAENTLKHQRQQDSDRKATLDANKAFTDSVKVDPNDPNKIIIDPALARRALDVANRNPDAANAKHEAEGLINWMQSKQREHAEVIVDNPQVKADFLARLGDGNKPLTKSDILGAEARGELSTRTGGIFRQMTDEMGPHLLHDPLVHSAVTAASERVGVGLVGDGHERYANFMQAFWPQYLAQKNAGTLKPNALDLKDETSLIRQSLKAYEPPQADRMMMHMLKSLGVNNIDQVTKSTAPAAVKAITLPPIEKRVKGSLYDTERGKMKWTGTGWVSP